MKNKYEELRNEILDKCRYYHKHYSYEYAGKTFIYRECDNNYMEICRFCGSDYLCFGSFFRDDICSTNGTSVSINGEEDEKFYRDLENQLVQDGNAFLINYDKKGKKLIYKNE